MGDTGKITDENSCRKDRARIFTKLFSPIRTKESGILKPPSRGSNVVVSVPEKDVACRKLRHGLFLLGTYYNLFVLLCLDDDEEKGIDRKIDASDRDVYKKEEAHKELTRFGFKVLLYSKSQQASTKQHSVSNN